MFEFTINDSLTVWWPGILILGLGVGMLTGLFGVGGGFILTPLLRIVFLVPYPIAVGTSLAMITMTSGYSALRYWRSNSLDPKLGMVMAAFALIGTRIGKHLMSLLVGSSGEIVFMGRAVSLLDLTLNLCFVVLMSLLGVFIFWETGRKMGQGEDTARSRLVESVQNVSLPPYISLPASGIARISLWIPLILGIVIGVLTGFLGVGGGFVTFPILLYVIGLPTFRAVGTSAMQIVFASAYGTALYWLDGRVEWFLVAMLLVTSLFGVRLGIWIMIKIGGRRIRRYFSLVLGLGVLVLLYGIFYGN